MTLSITDGISFCFHEIVLTVHLHFVGWVLFLWFDLNDARQLSAQNGTFSQKNKTHVLRLLM